jgi:hypothetical protein
MASWLLSLLLLGLAAQLAASTPLDDYVNRPDPTYSYRLINEYRGPGYTLYNINMTSQTWKSSMYVLFFFSSERNTVVLQNICDK